MDGDSNKSSLERGGRDKREIFMDTLEIISKGKFLGSQIVQDWAGAGKQRVSFYALPDGSIVHFSSHID